MYQADIIAKYFLSKDPTRTLFNNNVVERNNRKFYEGNARLNKYLFNLKFFILQDLMKNLF